MNKYNIGEKFGHLEIMGVTKDKYLCCCDCGNLVSILIKDLDQNKVFSCGKKNTASKISEGCKFGDLTVLIKDPRIYKKGNWICEQPNGRITSIPKYRILQYSNPRKNNFILKHKIIRDGIKCYTNKNEVFYISESCSWVLDQCWSINTSTSTIRVQARIKGENKTMSLQSYIMKDREYKKIKFIDGNRLNCRLENLELIL